MFLTEYVEQCTYNGFNVYIYQSVYTVLQDVVVLETRHGVQRGQLKNLVEKADKDGNGYIDR